MFKEAVMSAVATLGRNAPKIADHIMRQAFPRTVEESEREGAAKIFRRGVIDAVKNIISVPVNPESQTDFSDIDPAFAVIARRLKKSHYYVEDEIEQYVVVRELIENPAWLDSARKLMRRKGDENLAEAKVLDELYAAVIAVERQAAE
jgi:hypothetical protein